MDTGIARFYSVVDEVFVFVRGSDQGMEISEVERTVLAMLMRVGREALKFCVDEKGTGYRGKEIVNARGETLPYVRDRFNLLFSLVEMKGLEPSTTALRTQRRVARIEDFIENPNDFNPIRSVFVPVDPCLSLNV